MEVTTRELVAIVHGMLFGGFFLMAIGGAIVMLLEWPPPGPSATRKPSLHRPQPAGKPST
jgi:hypothetical protein